MRVGDAGCMILGVGGGAAAASAGSGGGDGLMVKQTYTHTEPGGSNWRKLPMFCVRISRSYDAVSFTSATSVAPLSTVRSPHCRSPFSQPIIIEVIIH